MIPRVNRAARLSFFVGGVFSGMIIVNESFAMGRSYGHAFLVVAGFLFWASLWVAYAPENPNWIFLVSTACGIQNGVTTRYSGNVVRTTHMTGLTTDVGTSNLPECASVRHV